MLWRMRRRRSIGAVWIRVVIPRLVAVGLGWVVRRLVAGMVAVGLRHGARGRRHGPGRGPRRRAPRTAPAAIRQRRRRSRRHRYVLRACKNYFVTQSQHKNILMST